MKLQTALACLIFGASNLSMAAPPVAQPTKAQQTLIGKPAWEAFNTTDTNGMLMILLGNAYKDIKLRLSTAGAMTQDGDWIFGSGNAPRAGGEDEAAIAINVEKRQVMAAALFGGKQIRLFGGNDLAQFPPRLQEWIKARQATLGANGTNSVNAPVSARSEPVNALPTPIKEQPRLLGQWDCGNFKIERFADGEFILHATPDRDTEYYKFGAFWFDGKKLFERYVATKFVLAPIIGASPWQVATKGAQALRSNYFTIEYIVNEAYDELTLMPQQIVNWDGIDKADMTRRRPDSCKKVTSTSQQYVIEKRNVPSQLRELAKQTSATLQTRASDPLQILVSDKADRDLAILLQRSGRTDFADYKKLSKKERAERDLTQMTVQLNAMEASGSQRCLVHAEQMRRMQNQAWGSYQQAESMAHRPTAESLYAAASMYALNASATYKCH